MHFDTFDVKDFPYIQLDKVQTMGVHHNRMDPEQTDIEGVDS